MIRCMLLNSDKSYSYGDESLIDSWREDKSTMLWVDIDSHDKEQEYVLLKALGCHSLAITDAQRDRHPPKIELFDNYIFMLYRGIFHSREDLLFEHLQISMFVGTNILITSHAQKSISIDKLFSVEGEKFLMKSPITLALRIFHYSCGIYLQKLFEFEEKLEALEDKFQLGGDDKMMQEITLYRSRLTKLKRTFSYHSNIGSELKILVADETPIINQAELHTVIDVHERIDRLLTLSQMHYDICSDLVNGYLSITSHQLNATMRVLTVITAIFIPLGFLAGIYGMNFEYIPELKAENGYFYLIGFMAFLSLTLVLLFKKKRWL
ncbi:metal transporter [Psychromonas sp. RZ22]|uniref:magnesium transporter CorA family protein n=1 Tax=Psychromonas algarum TaxID=2555643 RepID=UPI0010682439|nr:magnesium transporter CorA family protein [Psychromonas sp. RZ22]TEW54677.1 metal transporter [Psychromonas sp. RZ22]